MVGAARLHTQVFNSIDEQIAVIDRSGTIIDVNAAWKAFGAENGIVETFASVGSNYLQVVEASVFSGDALAMEVSAGILDVIKGKRADFRYEYPCHSPEKKRWFMMHVKPLEGSGKMLFVITHHDITQRRLAEEHAAFLSRHDPLTGLANRRRFNEFVQEALQRGARNSASVTLLELDLDNFKSFNDALGHPAGDDGLVKVAGVLHEHTRRADDLAARLGGDEFAVVLGGNDMKVHQETAASIRREIEALGLAFDAGKRRVTTSIGGVSLLPGHGERVETLLAAADRMLYRAKAQGRNRVVFEPLPQWSLEE
ncbi:diguanylate cyclase [Sulfurimonas sp. HSL-3221]|uniref:sensor domain-containing diguanylate cyclase n=1 Tax=Sulfurimonadaceae TaxID=2771471 RepID=UPI001E57F2B2|nr:GGDEF domain-containing protein [Sulfurimonas sp. HSL-3221]UFS63498.1 diguanylate cyclase [Sulfurimonas sp. HSL-3221]